MVGKHLKYWGILSCKLAIVPTIWIICVIACYLILIFLSKRDIKGCPQYKDIISCTNDCFCGWCVPMNICEPVIIFHNPSNIENCNTTVTVQGTEGDGFIKCPKLRDVIMLMTVPFTVYCIVVFTWYAGRLIALSIISRCGYRIEDTQMLLLKREGELEPKGIGVKKKMLKEPSLPALRDCGYD